MMKILRRGRSLRWLSILLALAIFYFIFQGLILRILNKDARGNSIMRLLLEEEVLQEFSIPRGIRLEDKELYRPKPRHGFRCLDDSKYIPWVNVNDDYCDCEEDGSDEPGTAACTRGRFYCQESKEYIFSSRVNDGICDCCDGADEWNGSLSHNKVKDNPIVKGIEIAPCGSVCKDLFDHKYVNAQQRLGLRLKKQYLVAGKQHKNGLYGKDGEFFKLSKECFQYSTARGKYVVCPFRYIREDNGEHFYNMGRDAKIMGKKPDGSDRLVMMNGDSHHCPGGVHRQTQLEFICGLSDHVMNIHEEEACMYTLRFSTPAGC